MRKLGDRVLPKCWSFWGEGQQSSHGTGGGMWTKITNAKGVQQSLHGTGGGMWTKITNAKGGVSVKV